MDIINDLFGTNNNLSISQMCFRGFMVFFIALFFLKIAGRRAFGMHSPFDNVIGILLGAILAKGLAGSSPFLPIICTSLLIVILHRVCGWIALKSDKFGKLIKGDRMLIYDKGKKFRQNMNKSLITDKDLLEGLRKEANVESLTEIKRIYVERDGTLSVIK